MDTEERMNELQKDMGVVKQEVQELLVDMRLYLLEAQNPIRWIPAGVKEMGAAMGETQKKEGRNNGS